MGVFNPHVNNNNNNGSNINNQLSPHIMSTMNTNGGSDTCDLLYKRYKEVLGVHIFKKSYLTESIMLC